jgi:c-di-GMP-binding flagellar brake protein YcgR
MRAATPVWEASHGMDGKHGRPAGAERRKHPRAHINLEAVLQGDRPEDDLRLKVLNFSAGGFFCRSSREIEPLTRLGITFQFPPYAEHPPRTLETTAVVVRCEASDSPNGGYKMAAAFLSLGADVKRHIQAYVDWYKLVYGESEAA